MIRLDYIKGTNIGRHRLVEKKVTGNVLGLWGVSGAGKSTILQLLEWLITGKIEHPDPIAEFVRNSEAEDIKKMTGEAHFTVDGKPMEIHRSHSKAGTSSRELKWDKQGAKWATTEKSAAGADALMTSLVGANQKAISSIMFIRQGAFSKLFSGLDSDRREFFVRLLMLGHLEKIASIVDTYRKQMMGSVQDMSAIRDQSESAYRQAQAYFEEIEDAMSRMRSYAPELAAGAELTRIMDQLVSREADMSELGTALDAGLASIGIDRAAMQEWFKTTSEELEKMRADLKTATDRRTSRNAYESSQSRLKSEITTIGAWMEKSQQHTEVSEKLTAMAADVDKPDPRLRIAKLDAWEEAYRERQSYQADIAAAPTGDPAMVESLEAKAEEALQKSTDAAGLWNQAVADYNDLKALNEASNGRTGDTCRLCGNEHPDPKFLAIAIANNAALKEKLGAESNELEAARRETRKAANDAKEALTAATNRLDNLRKRLAEIEASLEGAPPGDAIVAERDALHAKLPGYDAAKSMRAHLQEQQRVLSLAMGEVSYNQNDIDSRKSELDLAEQMLGMLPAAEALAATIQELTDKGVALKAKYDTISAQHDKFAGAAGAYHAQAETLKEKVTSLTKERPFLISSIQALGPVMTAEHRDQVMVELREKQTKYDAQTGLMEAARRAMVEADKSLQEIDVKIEEQKNRIQIGKELEAVRAAFLPSGITTEYLAHQFERIAIATQDHLSQMSADFMVISSESRALSFDFVRLNEPNGSWLNQNRMSGGQQVKLAVAVLFAIHELIMPQVGMLVLDEPSTHLDPDSKVAMAEMLREISLRGNFQLIVCDHSHELKDAYTDVIELYADPV